MPSNDSLLDQTFSHYRIPERLGNGGVGVVFNSISSGRTTANNCAWPKAKKNSDVLLISNFR
jgi:hypothetical protein